MLYYDWTYILVIIGAVITLAASAKLKSTYAKYSKVKAQCGLTGKQVAEKILHENGIYGVTVGIVQGELTDHYDPSKKVLNLSPAISNGTSIAALGVAAHECGHAIQDSEEYAALRLRSSLVPAVNIGSKLAWPMILIGLIFGGVLGSTNISSLIATIGICLFGLAVLFQLVTLPVEYNASSRALTQLEGLQILTNEEEGQAKKVLKAAALTYVASAASSLLQLLRIILIFGGRKNRD